MGGDFWSIVDQFTDQYRLTSKGQKTLESMLKNYWTGRKFSLKELLMLERLNGLKFISNSNISSFSNFQTEIKSELKKRFDIELTPVLTYETSSYLEQRGMLEPNPQYNQRLRDLVVNTLEKDSNKLGGTN